MRAPVKPPALKAGSKIAVVAPASPVEKSRLDTGISELARLGYQCGYNSNVLQHDGYFAGPVEHRHADLVRALADRDAVAVCCARGGYGANYLVERLDARTFRFPKIVLGYSDITSLQIFLWQKLGWVTFYGPMAASGFDAGANVPGGYDAESFERAVSETREGWSLDFESEALVAGEVDGILLGGCLTVLVTTLHTPWELNTRGAILVLEDRGMKPYQVDRALMHLKQAGKFEGVRGILLGDFPECEPPETGSATVRDVCKRILSPLGLPVVFGVPIGHTTRPMLTLPLGVRARLYARGVSDLEILEPAVSG